MSEAPDEAVGSLAEETAKLVGALAGWARDSDLGAAASGFTDAAGEWLGGLGEAPHADEDAGEPHACPDGDPQCRWCPVCRVARAVGPEVRGHLLAAVVSLGRAAEAMLATPARGEGPDRAAEPGAGGGAAGFEPIDLDDWE